MWKENVLEELEAGELEFKIVGEFLVEIKKKFVCRRRGEVSEGSGVKKAGAGRKDNGRICL